MVCYPVNEWAEKTQLGEAVAKAPKVANVKVKCGTGFDVDQVARIRIC